MHRQSSTKRRLSIFLLAMGGVMARAQGTVGTPWWWNSDILAALVASPAPRIPSDPWLGRVDTGNDPVMAELVTAARRGIETLTGSEAGDLTIPGALALRDALGPSGDAGGLRLVAAASVTWIQESEPVIRLRVGRGAVDVLVEAALARQDGQWSLDHIMGIDTVDTGASTLGDLHRYRMESERPGSNGN